jgi:hypothetical protein
MVPIARAPKGAIGTKEIETMTDPTTPFGALPDGAEQIAVVDNWEYLRVEWIYRRQANGPLDYYATAAAWPTTPACQLGWRDTLIRNLQARVAELEQQLASQASADRLAVELAPAATLPAPAEPGAEPAEEHPCPDCDRPPLKSAKALLMHRIKAHGYRTPPAPAEAPEQSAPPPNPATMLPVKDSDRRLALDAAQEQPERPSSCRQCGRSNAIVAPSMRDPTLCIQCAVDQAIDVASNGHLVHA